MINRFCLKGLHVWWAGEARNRKQSAAVRTVDALQAQCRERPSPPVAASHPDSSQFTPLSLLHPYLLPWPVSFPSGAHCIKKIALYSKNSFPTLLLNPETSELPLTTRGMKCELKSLTCQNFHSWASLASWFLSVCHLPSRIHMLPFSDLPPAGSCLEWTPREIIA